MLDIGIELNLIKARSTHTDMQIFRENKLHTVDVTDGFVESLGPVKVLLMGHLLRMDVISYNFPILLKGILGTDFLKNSTPTDIRYDMQGFVKWHGISIPCTRQDAVLIPAKVGQPKNFILK